MGHRLAAVTAFLAVAVGGCGDPFIVVGDAPGIVRIVAGIPGEAGDSLGALATRSRLHAPRGLAADAGGVLYIADQRNARVLAVESSGAIEVLVDHSDRAQEPRLRAPDGLALDGGGGLYIADPEGHRIWRLELTTREMSVVAGTGIRGSSPDTAEAVSADLDTPTGIAVDPAGRVYFSEFRGHRIRRLDAGGSLVTIAGDGLGGSGGDGGPAERARLRRPTGLSIAGNVLYIADSGNHAVRAVDLASGIIELVAGRGLAGFDGDGGPAEEALLDTPLAVAAHPDGGSLFIADSENRRVRAVNLATRTISTFAGTGEETFNGDLLAAGVTALGLPSGLVVSPLGFLYMSDVLHHVVRRSAVRFVEGR
jgi:sugar lactone lactonase YvrE